MNLKVIVKSTYLDGIKCIYTSDLLKLAYLGGIKCIYTSDLLKSTYLGGIKCIYTSDLVKTAYGGGTDRLQAKYYTLKDKSYSHGLDTGE